MTGFPNFTRVNGLREGKTLNSITLSVEAEEYALPLQKRSSSSCRTVSTDLPDTLQPPVSIVHCSRKVFNAISSISTELLYIGSSWLTCLCSSM